MEAIFKIRVMPCECEKCQCEFASALGSEANSHLNNNTFEWRLTNVADTFEGHRSVCFSNPYDIFLL